MQLLYNSTVIFWEINSQRKNKLHKSIHKSQEQFRTGNKPHVLQLSTAKVRYIQIWMIT